MASEYNKLGKYLDELRGQLEDMESIDADLFDQLSEQQQIDIVNGVKMTANMAKATKERHIEW